MRDNLLMTGSRSSKDMKNIILLFVTVSVISACAGVRTDRATEVHFFTQGMEDAEVTRVSKALSELGYQIELNSLSVPATVEGPTVVHSPLFINRSRVQELIDRLVKLGYTQINVQLTKKSNHFYTGNNIGLYLKAYSDIVTNESGDNLLQRVYAGQCPNADGELTFGKGGKFSVELYVWDEKSDAETKILIDGKWRRDGEMIFLSLNHGIEKFKISHFRNSNQYGVTEGILLKNQTNGEKLYNCDFVFRTIELK